MQGAARHPDRVLLARRNAAGEWDLITYRQMLEQIRPLGQALLDRGLSADRPLLILSGNSLAHWQLALAAMYVGVPYCPVSPAYSLVATDFAKLQHIVSTVTPGMVYADNWQDYQRAIQAVIPDSTEVVVSGQAEGAARQVALLAGLMRTVPVAVEQANAGVTADSIAKFLFTSGSTRQPKAVVTTHRMLCSNQQMLLQTFPCFGEEPPVLVDWLPWNHTFGGSHNVGIALYNGGSYYIDDGKPTPAGFAETVRNLKDIAPTVCFNVPKGWEMLAEALEADSALRDNFYSRMKLFFFAGAGLSQAAWNKLERVTEAHCGERIRIISGLGMTETSPSCTFSNGPVVSAGYIGLPAPGCRVKLAPVDGKLEARFKGEHVMPGYWRAPELTRAVFDEEGYYCSGDAVRFVDAGQPEQGLMFDGRIAEDFKLSSGTFVSVGPLRARIISDGAPYVQDAVITGINQDDIGVMIFPRLDHCRYLAGLPMDASVETVLANPDVEGVFRQLLAKLNDVATGSASRIAWLYLLAEPPSLDHGEQTDKGSINQRAVLTRRAELVDRLYAGLQPGRVPSG